MLPILLLLILVPFAALVPLALVGRKYAFHVSAAASLVAFLLTAYALYYSYMNGASGLSFSSF